MIFDDASTHVLLRRAGALLLALGASFLLATGTACNEGHEGDRCNPDRSSDECNSGLSCQTPSTCVESYCCPADPSTSSDPYCNGSACPAADGGTDASDDASSDAGAGGASGASGAGGASGSGGTSS